MRVLRQLICCLLLFGLLPLAGCARSGPPRIRLRYWNGFTGPDGRTMLRLVQRFNRENPDVNVLMQRMDWATYYNKLFVAGIGRRAPEVFVLQSWAVERFARARFVRTIDDLTGGANGLNAQNIDPNIWDSVQVGGKHYGLPLDIWLLGMYTNRRLLREAGLVDARGEPKPPQTRQEFLDAARRLTRDTNGDGTPDQWGFVFTNLDSNVYTVMRQFGGPFFTPDHSRCLLNDPRNVAALQFCCDLIRRYRVAPPPENFDAWIGFRQGKVGMAFEGIYMLDDLRKQHDLDYGGAPVPLLGAERAVWAGSHNLCLRADLKGPELQAAWRFLKFLSDNSIDWAAGGQVPARRDLRDTARFRAMPVQSAFARQIPYVSYMPRIPFFFEFQTEFDTAIEKALRGSATPQAALDTATANVNAVIARQRALLAAAGGAR
jgi:multiple sugar transport system substrate-binding protein